MSEALNRLDTIDEPDFCGTCGGSLVADRYIQMDVWGAPVAAFCSEPCYRAGLREQRKRRWAHRRLHTKRLAIGAILVGALLTPHGPLHERPRRGAQAAAPVRAPVAAPRAALPPGWFGPEWPPTEVSVLAALGRDAWVHPLPGPVRRMPRTDARVFGGVRPGNRPAECRNGHCGVDLGGEIWGEHVHAVHDGIVDFVQRGLNTQHGGKFVRIAHKNGTVFSQYFHLAAIPRGLERGKYVKVGDVVGLLGDTGVKESAPHLHFTISIRLSKDRPEKYIDPEPLIALWPLHVPVEGSEVGLVTTVGQLAVPIGSMPLLSAKARALAKKKRTGAGGKSDSAAEAASAPEEEESTPEAPVADNPGDE